MVKCCVCRETLTYKIEGKEQFPVCEKKQCIKSIIEVFCGIYRNVDKETGNETEGFFFCNNLLRYDHFDEDFERIWKETHEFKEVE